MDIKSAATAEATPVVIEATTHLEEVNRDPRDDVEKHKKDTHDEKTSDVMEILQGLVDRLQKMEEKMDCRLQKMEEKMDLLISSEKPEAENMFMDESSSDEEPFLKKARANIKIPKEESSDDHIAEKSDEKYSDDRFGLFGSRGRGQVRGKRFGLFRGRGRVPETVDRFGRFFDDGQENNDRLWGFPGDYGQDGDDSYGRSYGGRARGLLVGGRARVHGLLVGGRLRGGRCGGQGFCGGC